MTNSIIYDEKYFEEKEKLVDDYLKEHKIRATVTNVLEKGFSYMLNTGQEYYISYSNM